MSSVHIESLRLLAVLIILTFHLAFSSSCYYTSKASSSSSACWKKKKTKRLYLSQCFHGKHKPEGPPLSAKHMNKRAAWLVLCIILSSVSSLESQSKKKKIVLIGSLTCDVGHWIRSLQKPRCPNGGRTAGDPSLFPVCFFMCLKKIWKVNTHTQKMDQERGTRGQEKKRMRRGEGRIDQRG